MCREGRFILLGLFIRFVPRQPWVTRTMGHQVLVREYQKNLRGPIIFLVTSLWRPYFMAWLDKESLEIDLTKISEPFSYKVTPDDNLIPSCPLFDWYQYIIRKNNDSYCLTHRVWLKLQESYNRALEIISFVIVSFCDFCLKHFSIFWPYNNRFRRKCPILF